MFAFLLAALIVCSAFMTGHNENKPHGQGHEPSKQNWKLGFPNMTELLMNTSTQDSVLMMTSDGDDPNIAKWDSRRYPKCPPFNGRKGHPFEVFIRNISNYLSSEEDEEDDLEQTMLGKDRGGDVWLADGGTEPTAAAAERHASRLKKLYNILYFYVTDERLRDMLHDDCKNDGREAFKLLVIHCRSPTTDLEMFALENDWTNASFTIVGVSKDSPTLLMRYLIGLNSRRPTDKKKTDNEITLKFLACFKSSINQALGMEALKEIGREEPDWLYHHTKGGN